MCIVESQAYANRNSVPCWMVALKHVEMHARQGNHPPEAGLKMNETVDCPLMAQLHFLKLV